MYSFDPFSTRCLRISTSSAPSNTTGRGSETEESGWQQIEKMEKGGRDDRGEGERQGEKDKEQEEAREGGVEEGEPEVEIEAGRVLVNSPNYCGHFFFCN